MKNGENFYYQTVMLYRNGKEVARKKYQNQKRRQEIIDVWKHTYGPKIFGECTIQDIKNYKKPLYMQQDTNCKKLKEFLKQNLKQVEPDILSDALDIIVEIEAEIKILKKQNAECDDLRDANEELIYENQNAAIELAEIKDNFEVMSQSMNTIDFGVGKVHYAIAKESSMYITEIMQALNECRTTPLTDILKRLR